MRKLTSFDLVGKTYNGLTIKSFNSTTDEGRDLYNCQCICGNTVVLVGVDVRNNKPRTCGCNTSYTTYIGKRYGKLEVTESISGNRTDRLLVKCDCGVQFEVNGSQLRYGYLTSCGCSAETKNNVRREESSTIDLSNMETILQNKVTGILLQSSRNLNKLRKEDIVFITQDRLYDIENGLAKVTNKELTQLLKTYKVSSEVFNKLLESTKNRLRLRISEIGMDTKMTLPELIDAIVINGLKGHKVK